MRSAVFGMDDVRTVLRRPRAASSRTPTGPAVAAQMALRFRGPARQAAFLPAAIAYLDGRHDGTLYHDRSARHTVNAG